MCIYICIHICVTIRDVCDHAYIYIYIRIHICVTVRDVCDHACLHILRCRVGQQESERGEASERHSMDSTQTKRGREKDKPLHSEEEAVNLLTCRPASPRMSRSISQNTSGVQRC